MNSDKNELKQLYQRAVALRQYGLLTRWDELCREPWVRQLIELEEFERIRRSREYRIKNAKIGRFKAMANFDWKHPQKIDRELIEELFELSFIEDGTNVIALGPNGVGKTMLAQNLAYRAVIHGHSVRFASASDMLNDLSGLDGSTLKYRLKRYVGPKLLVVDELGYLRYDDRHADLLFQVITRRYEHRSSIVLTTNKPFSEWNQVFDSAGCLVTLIDRLCHRAELVEIRGQSYRVKEANQRAAERRSKRRKSRKKTDN